MTTRTKITLPITITLEGLRYCTRCQLRSFDLCLAFQTKQRWSRKLRFDHGAEQYIRLPQCIAAAKEVE